MVALRRGYALPVEARKKHEVSQIWASFGQDPIPGQEPRIVLGPDRQRGEIYFCSISFGGIDVAKIIPDLQMTARKSAIVSMKID